MCPYCDLVQHVWYAVKGLNLVMVQNPCNLRQALSTRSPLTGAVIWSWPRNRRLWLGCLGYPWLPLPRIGVNGSWFLLISWLLCPSSSPISNVLCLNKFGHKKKNGPADSATMIDLLFGEQMTEAKVLLGDLDKCILLF